MQDKYQLRFKVLEEKLKASPNGFSRTPKGERSIRNGHLRRQSLGGVENLSRATSNGFLSKKTNSQCGSFQSIKASALLQHATISSGSFDGGSRSVDRDKLVTNPTEKYDGLPDAGDQIHSKMIKPHEENGFSIDKTKTEQDDCVSGMLYDMIQKEVLTLRKVCREKDQSLKDKDDAIEVRNFCICSSLSLSPSLTYIHTCKDVYQFYWSDVYHADVGEEGRNIKQGRNGSWPKK